jgi:hypothetical protein
MEIWVVRGGKLILLRILEHSEVIRSEVRFQGSCPGHLDKLRINPHFFQSDVNLVILRVRVKRRVIFIRIWDRRGVSIEVEFKDVGGIFVVGIGFRGWKISIRIKGRVSLVIQRVVSAKIISHMGKRRQGEVFLHHGIVSSGGETRLLVDIVVFIA